MRRNWITIYDSNSDGTVIYASNGITDCTQFEPEEFLGRSGYSTFHPDDIGVIAKAHVSNAYNEPLSSMSTYRHVCKNGEYVLIDAVVTYCHDLLIACHYIVDESIILGENILEHKMRISAVDEWFFCEVPKGPVQKVVSWKDRKVIKITREQVWTNDQLTKPHEKRVCLILNRYTDNLNIVYASRLAPELLGIDPNECLGKSIYDFLSETDCMSLQIHMDLAKKHHTTLRIRFDWIIDAEKNVSEQFEGVTCGTDDGLLMVIRPAPKIIISQAQ